MLVFITEVLMSIIVKFTCSYLSFLQNGLSKLSLNRMSSYKFHSNRLDHILGILIQQMPFSACGFVPAEYYWKPYGSWLLKRGAKTLSRTEHRQNTPDLVAPQDEPSAQGNNTFHLSTPVICDE